MKFKYRKTTPKEQKTDYFEAETVEQAIEIINDLESEPHTIVRAYEVKSGCRIVGGKLVKG